MNHKSQTALMLAAEAGMVLLVKRLISCKLSLLSTDEREQTVLHYALRATKNQMELVCLLLGVPKGVDVQMVNASCRGILRNSVVGIEVNRVNVDLLHATFRGGVITDEEKKLCDSSVLELLSALLHNTNISEKLVFVDEDDL